MVKNIHGYNIVINNSIPHFGVNTTERYIEFNQAWKEKLTEQEVLFCVRWAKVLQRKGNSDYVLIDTIVMKWYTDKFGKDAVNRFLLKITDKHLYNRLAFGSMVNNAKKTRWQRLKLYFSSGK